MTILRNLQAIGISETEITKLKGESLQRKLAHRLRVAAINNLQNGKGPVATAFRNDYKVIAGIGEAKEIAHESSYDIFLNNQIRPAVMGTYLEAASLGELFDCNVVVTPVTKGIEQTASYLHEASSPRAPTILLYCVDNNHWYITKNKPNQTLKDGNCLYNAFAQELKKMVINEKRQAKKYDSFFKENQPEAIKHQQELLSTVQKKMSREELIAHLDHHLNRESLLSETEKQQLRVSYQAAFHLANQVLREARGESEQRERFLLMI